MHCAIWSTPNHPMITNGMAHIASGIIIRYHINFKVNLTTLSKKSDLVLSACIYDLLKNNYYSVIGLQILYTIKFYDNSICPGAKTIRK